ncbi:MAG: hypothetical protein R3F61_36520 [Myxococcota bacterium]
MRANASMRSRTGAPECSESLVAVPQGDTFRHAVALDDGTVLATSVRGLATRAVDGTWSFEPDSEVRGSVLATGFGEVWALDSSTLRRRVGGEWVEVPLPPETGSLVPTEVFEVTAPGVVELAFLDAGSVWQQRIDSTLPVDDPQNAPVNLGAMWLFDLTRLSDGRLAGVSSDFIHVSNGAGGWTTVPHYVDDARRLAEVGDALIVAGREVRIGTVDEVANVFTVLDRTDNPWAFGQKPTDILVRAPDDIWVTFVDRIGPEPQTGWLHYDGVAWSIAGEFGDEVPLLLDGPELLALGGDTGRLALALSPAELTIDLDEFSVRSSIYAVDDLTRDVVLAGPYGWKSFDGSGLLSSVPYRTEGVIHAISASGGRVVASIEGRGGTRLVTFEGSAVVDDVPSREADALCAIDGVHFALSTDHEVWYGPVIEGQVRVAGAWAPIDLVRLGARRFDSAPPSPRRACGWGSRRPTGPQSPTGTAPMRGSCATSRTRRWTRSPSLRTATCGSGPRRPRGSRGWPHPPACPTSSTRAGARRRARRSESSVASSPGSRGPS